MHFRVITEDELTEIERVLVPPTAARAGWRIDVEAVKQACLTLGIELPVRIRYIRARRRDGTHYERSVPDYHHRITINQDRGIERSNETLWHELAHAMQAERFARETGKPFYYFMREYKAAKGEYGASYKNNYYEVEAREIAAKYAPERRLLK